MYILDAHCDAPTMAYRGRDFGKDNPGVQVDFPKMLRGGVSGSFFALYIPASLGNAEAYAYMNAQLDAIRAQLAANADKAAFAVDSAGMESNWAQGLVSVFLGLENGSALLAGPSVPEEIYAEGVRYVTLCHSADNELCDSCTGNGRWGGLSPKGREMVERLNSLGMMVDVAHTSNAVVRDVLDISDRPVAYTHGCCSALCSHPRNLPDELMRAIAEKGGVSCISIFPCFLSDDYSDFDDDKPDSRPMPPLSLVLDHICRAVRVAGVEGVGIGTDYDGISHTAKGLESIENMGKIFDGLRERGFCSSEIEKIASQNLLRVISSQR